MIPSIASPTHHFYITSYHPTLRCGTLYYMRQYFQHHYHKSSFKFPDFTVWGLHQRQFIRFFLDHAGKETDGAFGRWSQTFHSPWGFGFWLPHLTPVAIKPVYIRYFSHQRLKLALATSALYPHIVIPKPPLTVSHFDSCSFKYI
jgi:hypothetical protein